MCVVYHMLHVVKIIIIYLIRNSCCAQVPLNITSSDYTMLIKHNMYSKTFSEFITIKVLVYTALYIAYKRAT